MMSEFDMFLDTFINGDYFLVFLAVVVIILVVLVVALIKTREDYKELLDEKEDIELNAEVKPTTKKDFFEELIAETKDEQIESDKPLIKQIDVSSLKTYDDEIHEYEFNEEESAIISAEELSVKTQERIDIFPGKTVKTSKKANLICIFEI